MDFEEILKFVDEVVYAKTKKHLKDVQIAILRGACLGQSYDEIAEVLGYTDKYLKQDIGPKLWKLLSFVFGEKVSKTNFQSAVERQWQLWKHHASSEAIQRFPESSVRVNILDVAAYTDETQTLTRYQDWGEAVDVSVFYGRNEELAILKQWCIIDDCRVVTILGVGGVGKTTLSVKLAIQITSCFDFVIWRSLQNAPSVEDILVDLIQFFSKQQEISLSDTLEEKVSRVLHYFRSSRCLVILDNWETVLQSGMSTGQYNQGFEGYGYLLKRIGEVNHQSCLILTTREKPKEVALLSGPTLKVRSLLLSGLTLLEGREIFDAKGCFGASEQELQEICTYYAGIPLALKITAAAAQEVCGGDLGQLIPFLQQGKLQFEDINDLLEQQFNRLSSLEQQVMYWLAINREPVSLLQLEADFVSETVKRQLLSAVQSLNRRAFIEQNTKQLVLQPIVLEYVTQRMITGVCQDIANEQQEFLKNYALVKAQSKDYIRQAQIRLILQPIIERLVEMFGSISSVERKLKDILAKLQQEMPLNPGYSAGNILNILSEINADFSHLDCSYLTIWQAYLKGKTLQYVNFAYSDLIKSVFTETFGNVLWLEFSPNGEYIATGGTDGEIRLWQVANGQQLVQWKAHTNWIRSGAFSPNGLTLASGSADCKVKLWDIKTRQCLQTFSGHVSRVWSVTFSPNGYTLASSSDDQTIRLWNLKTGECFRIFQGHTGRIRSVIFSSDGQTLISSSDDQTIRFWDLKTGQCLKTLHEYTHGIRAIALSPVCVRRAYASRLESSQGCVQILASGGADCTIRLWNVKTEKYLTTLQGHLSEVWSLSFSSDGQILASSSHDRTIKLWDVNTGQCLKTLQGHTQEVWSVRFSPDRQILASSSSDRTIKLWDVNTGQCLKTLQGYTNGVCSVRCSPDSQTLAVSSADNVVKLWNISTGQYLRTLQGHKNQVWSVAFSPQGNTLATGSSDHTVRLWNVETGQCMKVLDGHTNWVWSVTFSPEGNTLASSSDDCTVKLWSLSTGECLKTLRGHNNWVWSIDFNTDGSILASSSNDQTVRLWNVQTGQCVKILQGHTNGIRAVRFSPDGQSIATGSEDHTVKIWDVSKGKCIKALEGHTDWVWSVDFSTDGSILASSSNDQTVRLWDVQTGECLKVLQGHTNWVRAVCFHPNSLFLITGSEDETTKLWDVETGKCITSFINPKPYEGMNIARATGLTDAQRFTFKALGAIEFVED